MEKKPTKIVFRIHALQRMFERRISEEDARAVIESGEVIEDYPDDKPYPSQLLLGRRDARPIHIVVARNVEDGETVVITVYEPDPKQWEADFKRRKKQ